MPGKSKPVFYRVEESNYLFNEMNKIALTLKTLRDMVTSTRMIPKREWEDFLLSSEEVCDSIKDWTDKVVRRKRKVNNDLILGEVEEREDDSED